MYLSLKLYCDSLLKEMNSIPENRKVLLDKITAYIKSKQESGRPTKLIYICTHNSRRSHFGQIWAMGAAAYFNIPEVQTYSGGTQATAFHKNAIEALKRCGFRIHSLKSETNPVYDVLFDDMAVPIKCFSKVYDDPANPSSEFAAIMTCGDAEANCPYIPNVELRIATTYNDPKEFDGTALQDLKYDERCRQIALESMYIFCGIKNN